MSQIASLFHKKIEEKRVLLGNTRREPKHLASDLLNEDIGRNRKRLNVVAAGCYLCPQTIERMMELPERYRPQEETTMRILRYYNYTLFGELTVIKPEFQNGPKMAVRSDYDLEDE